MKCAACGALGGEGARFCAECGAALSTGESGLTATAVDVRQMTPFVNRRDDLGPLLELWERARAGAGQAALIKGEPGIGKSRLAYELHEAATSAPHTWLECACSAFTQHSALRPVVDLAQQALGFRDHDDQTQRLARIESGVAELGIEGDDAVPLLAQLLSIPAPTSPARAAPSPAQQRHRTLDLFTQLALALAQRRPIIVLVEDLQWADASSLELFERLIERGVDSPLLLLGTARPEFEPAWSSIPNFTTIELGPLAEVEVVRLVRQLSPVAQLPDAVVEHVAGATDGIPLFAEEMAKTLLKSDWLAGHGATFDLESQIDPIDIPATLYDSLMARLDRISRRRPAAKRVAQRAAAIGPEFDQALVEEVVGLEPDVVRHGLARLVEDDLLLRRGEAPRATYAFRHALIHEAAYRSLLKLQRRDLHARTAAALERRRAADQSAVSPEVIARHHDAAGQKDRAVALFREAADQAVRQSAHHEAIAHLERAIGLVGELPGERSWQAVEADLQTALGSSIIAVRGYGDPGIESAYQRAHALYERLGDERQVGYTLAGLSLFYFNHGEVDRGAELATRALEIARRARDESLRVLARVQLAIPRFYQGRFAVALEHVEDASAAHAVDRDRWLGFRYGTDQGVAAHCFAALALMRLGRPDSALARARAAVELGRSLSDPYNVAYALFFETAVHWNRGDVAAQLAMAQAVLSLAEEQQFELFVGLGRMFQGAARAFASGDPSCLELVYEGSGIAAATGFRGGLPAFTCLVAEAQHAVGRPADALGTVTAALQAADETGQHYWDSELHRLRGELALELGDADDGERALRQALEIADRQDAAWPRLRAATALAKLALASGDSAAAQQVLTPAHEHFEEGFATPAVRDAAAVLRRCADEGDAIAGAIGEQA